MTPEVTQRSILAQVRAAVARMAPDCHPSRACLYYGVATVDALLGIGVRAVLQGGTAFWRTKAADTDANQYGYQWCEDWLQHMTKGQMPEMHVWVGIPDRKEVVDLTTGLWPQAAREAGIEWEEALTPPEYLWARGEYPSGAYYLPNQQATIVANQLAASLTRGVPVVIPIIRGTPAHEKN